MARRGKIAYRCRTRKKVSAKKKGSDESDEDYMVVEEDGLDESEDEKHSFVSEDESEESLGEFEEEEEEDNGEHEEDSRKKKIKKVSRPRGGRKGFQGRKNDGVAKPRKEKAAYSEEENQDDDNFNGAKRRQKSRLSQDVEEGRGDVELQHGRKEARNRTRVSSAEKYADCIEKRQKKSQVSFREEKGDDDSNYNINEEFAPDDEKVLVTKRNRVSRLNRQATAQIAKRRKRKRNSEVVKRTMRRKPRTQQVIRRRNRPDPGKEFRDVNRISRNKERIIKQDRGRRKKSSVISDSDFLSSGSSDQDYTISEEEREQVREATEFCRMLTSNLRNNNVLKVISKEEVALSQRELPGKKGKEKLEDMTIEVGKQICGICLSEEGKRTVRGILNCCSHYFCFTCIMEWSKVESRCPLCKQRFATINRIARIDGKFNLRNATIPVPERDQVYQPSEEELRGYLDPYENVPCTECQQGGDDALMLLCDLCDSPAHTYCVGLGHEVPEGNWYCDGCKPTILGSSNAQAINSTSDHGADCNLSVVSSASATIGETFDLNELCVPNKPLAQSAGPSSSPRHSIGDFQAASPSSRSVAFTLFQRRQIQRQIHQLLDYRSRHSVRSDVVTQVFGSSLFGSQIVKEGDGVVSPQQTVAPARIEQQNVYDQGRLPNHSYLFPNSREALSPILSSSRGPISDNVASASRAHSLNGLPCNEYIGINLMIGQGSSNMHFHPCCSGPDRGPGTSLSSRQSREMSHSPQEKERVQTMVKRHLKSLSRNMEIGYRPFKDIARSSTHTILAAVGYEHRQNQVYPVQTRPVRCDHFGNRHTCPIRGQCCSCFDWFVRNVVREIMFTRVSVMPMG